MIQIKGEVEAVVQWSRSSGVFLDEALSRKGLNSWAFEHTFFFFLHVSTLLFHLYFLNQLTLILHHSPSFQTSFYFMSEVTGHLSGRHSYKALLSWPLFPSQRMLAYFTHVFLSCGWLWCGPLPYSRLFVLVSVGLISDSPKICYLLPLSEP